MVFLIYDEIKERHVTSDDPQLVEEMQKSVAFHPSYSCDILINDEGCLYLENSCGEIRGLPKRYRFVKLVQTAGD